MKYQVKGVCSRFVDVEVQDGIIQSVKFTGGCMGNTQGVAKLCEGKPVEDVVNLLQGINCGMKGTSCPDQLARVLKENYLD